MPMATAVRRTLDWVRAFVARVRAFVFRLLDTVPLLRRTVDELVRVEVIDRSMVIGAQALLALVPLVVVLGAFLPDVTRAALERLEDVTGMAGVSGELAAQVSRPTTESVRTQTGLVGLVVVVHRSVVASAAGCHAGRARFTLRSQDCAQPARRVKFR